jgi:hypothetical protein
MSEEGVMLAGMGGVAALLAWPLSQATADALGGEYAPISLVDASPGPDADPASALHDMGVSEAAAAAPDSGTSSDDDTGEDDEEWM